MGKWCCVSQCVSWSSIVHHCRLGVATLWNNMSEMQVEPDDELRAKVSTYVCGWKTLIMASLSYFQLVKSPIFSYLPYSVYKCS